MIHLFFVPGMFGSTIEYVASNYSNELTSVAGDILPDGSMHSFTKQAHFWDLESVDRFFTNKEHTGITTPVYPFRHHHLPEILECFKQYTRSSDRNVLVYASDIRAAELNLLFQWYKIAFGTTNKTGMELFCGGGEHNVTSWNDNYRSWKDMQPWELREWLSLFYPGVASEWINSRLVVDNTFLTISNTDMLYNPVETVRKVFNHCGLTETPGLEPFLHKWRKAQQYIVDEFSLLDQITAATINNRSLQWEPLTVIAEVIVQQRLRAKGYEIRCDGLNIFPTDSETLYKLLEIK